MAARLVLFALMISQFWVLTCSSGVFHLVLRSFGNDLGKDDDNEKCDPWPTNRKCDTIFKICLDLISRTGSAYGISSTECHYIYHKSPKFDDTNSVNFETFSDIEKSMSEMFIQHLDSSFPTGMAIRIKVYDYDSIGGDDDIDHIYTSVRWEGSKKPHRSLEEATWRQKTVLGSRDDYKTTLKYKYKIYCNRNYYGPVCGVYCVAQNSNGRGHYTCDPDTGEKVCRPGFEDVSNYCRTPIDDCVDHECENGATCVDKHQAYSCTCPPGYTGQRCQIDENECLSHPCENGGNCTDEVNAFSCTCPETHVGDRCQHLVCDLVLPCVNGGTCYGAGQCACPPGYDGATCENVQCDSMVCYHGGTCALGECECVTGYHGDLCQIDLCDDVVECFSGGTCHLGVCTCAAGYTGKYCHVNVNECVSDPCLYEGTCRDGVDSYTCDCLPSYTGIHCETLLTTPAEYVPSPTVTPRDTTNTAGHSTTPDGQSGSFENLGAIVDEDDDDTLIAGIPIWAWIILAVMLLLIILIIVIASLLCRYKRRARKASRDKEDMLATVDNLDNPMYLNNALASRQNSENGMLAVAGAVGWEYPPGPVKTVNEKDGNIYDNPPSGNVNYYTEEPVSSAAPDTPSGDSHHYDNPRRFDDPTYSEVPPVKPNNIQKALEDDYMDMSKGKDLHMSSGKEFEPWEK